MSTTEERRVDRDPGDLGIDLVSADDGTPVVHVRGEVDAATVGRLEACFAAVADVAAAGTRSVTVGLREVEFMDSSGINAVLDLRTRLGDGSQIHLQDCPPALRRVFDIVGLDRCAEITIS
jgi:anti-anti-sigma factor